MSQNYKPHTVIGSPMQKYLTNSKDVRILDVGAGTGLAAITVSHPYFYLHIYLQYTPYIIKKIHENLEVSFNVF